jgi:hypothetical protein
MSKRYNSVTHYNSPIVWNAYVQEKGKPLKNTFKKPFEVWFTECEVYARAIAKVRVEERFYNEYDNVDIVVRPYRLLEDKILDFTKFAPIYTKFGGKVVGKYMEPPHFIVRPIDFYKMVNASGFNLPLSWVNSFAKKANWETRELFYLFWFGEYGSGYNSAGALKKKLYSIGVDTIILPDTWAIHDEDEKRKMLNSKCGHRVHEFKDGKRTTTSLIATSHLVAFPNQVKLLNAKKFDPDSPYFDQ